MTLDQRILRALERDEPMSAAQIARLAGCEPEEALTRLRRMDGKLAVSGRNDGRVVWSLA